MREDAGTDADQPGTPGAISAGPRGAGASAEHVQRRSQDGVAILTLAGPGGNRFSPALAQALRRALRTALEDPGVRALVITARGPDFCAGPHSDLPPPGPDPAEAPALMDALDALCHQVAEAPRPVVCALHGRVASAGLALALAASARLADPRARLHFPETRLARLPPGNGAVRLAWRIGAGPALRVMALEAPMPAAAALDCGMVDGLEPEGLLPAAIARALSLAMSPPPGGAAPPGLRDGVAFHTAVAQARAALPRTLPAHRRHEALRLDAVEAAQLLPAEQALELDSVLAREAATGRAARALAHLSRAARRVLDTPEARVNTATQPRAGPILAALDPPEAAVLLPPLLRTGARITLIAPETGHLAATLEAVAEAQLAAVAAGSLPQADADADWSRLEGALAPDPDTAPRLALAGAAHLETLAAGLPADCPLLAWNTPRPAPPHPERCLALIPAPVRSRNGMAQLVELVVQADTLPEVATAATELMLALHLTPLRAGGRAMLPAMLHTARQTATRLAELGVAAGALHESGLLPAAALLPTGTPPPDTAPQSLPLPADRLLLLALINTGARLLENAQALRPSDIDIAMVLGAGFPNWRGGPMAEADTMGPLVLRHELLQAAPLDPALWSPAPLIDELIRQGWRFDDLNSD